MPGEPDELWGGRAGGGILVGESIVEVVESASA